MLKLDTPTISNNGLKKAIELLASECFGALSIANSLGGCQTEEWQILHNNPWKDIVDEGKNRGFDFESMKCAVTKTPLMRSARIQFILGQITEAESKNIFRKYVKTNGVWPE